jgi:hypothetical protein
MPEPYLIEYVPRRRKSSRAGRFVKLCAVITLAFGLFAVWRGMHLAHGEDISAALLIATPAFIFGGLGSLVAVGCWLRTGRFW